MTNIDPLTQREFPMICEHKHMYDPIFGAEIGGLVVVLLLITFSNLGGTSGGGLVTPFIIMFNGFNT